MFTVRFEHTSGGDSHLPREFRGFFDGEEERVTRAEVDAELARQPYAGDEAGSAVEQAAATVGLCRLLDRVKAEHPDWSRRATDDLSAYAVEE